MIGKIRRILYLVGGIAFMVLAYKDQVWWMGLFGLYFVAMAVFKLGCASGSCNHLPNSSDQEEDTPS